MKPQDDVKPNEGQSRSTVGLERPLLCCECGRRIDQNDDALLCIKCGGRNKLEEYDRKNRNR